MPIEATMQFCSVRCIQRPSVDSIEFVLNPVVPPGVFVSLMIVVSMTVSASILPNVFSLFSLKKSCPGQVRCKLRSGRPEGF